MKASFFDMQDDTNPLNGRVVEHDTELAEILDDLRARTPFLVELTSENGNCLLIGIGGRVGCVQHSRADAEPPYLMALAAIPNSTEEFVEFLMGDTPSLVAARYILPFEDVKEIAVAFLHTGQCTQAVACEEI
jgi:hypothetical protein